MFKISKLVNLSSTPRQLLAHYVGVTSHKARVSLNLVKVCAALLRRAWQHDASKFYEPEASMFAKVTPELADVTYGSEEYDRLKKQLAYALQHHYRHNSHHPEHFEGGIGEMGILDVVEMLCDWAAATHRHDDGDLDSSIEHNAEEYGYTERSAEKFREFYEETGMEGK